jgi:uncharacterized protein YjgD (DUF1641 family)
MKPGAKNMAKPLLFKPAPDDSRDELQTRLQNAPVEHAEAVLAGYQVLQGLHDAGALELLGGLLGSGDKVLQVAVDATRTPESVRIIRNLVVLSKMLGEIDPDIFEGIVQALPEAMHKAKAQGQEPPGLLGTLNQFRSKDLRRGIVAINRLLEAWGRVFFAEGASRPQS